MKKINLLSYLIVTLITVWINIFTIEAVSNSPATDVWEVEIVKKNTNEVVVNQIVAINTFYLVGLEENMEYFARVRTKNIFFSGWVTSDAFLYNSVTEIKLNNFNEKLIVRSEKGRVIISSNSPQKINIYNINGCLIRSVAIVTGETVVDGLEKGVYLANNWKVIVE